MNCTLFHFSGTNNILSRMRGLSFETIKIQINATNMLCEEFEYPGLHYCCKVSEDGRNCTVSGTSL